MKAIVALAVGITLGAVGGAWAWGTDPPGPTYPLGTLLRVSINNFEGYLSGVGYVWVKRNSVDGDVSLVVYRQ